MKKTSQRLLSICLILSIGVCGLPAAAAPAAPGIPQLATERSEASPNLTVFEENRGQLPSAVRFFARAGGSTVFLTADEAVYVLPVNQVPEGPIDQMEYDRKTQASKAFALRMKFIGANPRSTFSGTQPVEQRTNYFRGESSQWRTDIPNFSRVAYDEVYEGIGMVWHGLEGGATRYDFVVSPGADPGQIELAFDGADKLEVGAGGDLNIHTSAGTVTQQKPVTYQERDGIRSEVASSFAVVGDRVRFLLGDYDRSLPLTIDPTILTNNMALSTLLGSFADDIANDVAVDANGNTYVVGRTDSISFPTTSGTFDTSQNGSSDAFVAKLNSSGTGLVFSTYLGGTFFDEALGLAVDADGNIYVAGSASSGFPVTVGAFDESFNGSNDVFITKLNAAGSGLVYSTYVGAAQLDYAQDLAIDPAGNAYVVVRTQDAVVDYPTTPGAFDTTQNGSDDVAVTKINPAGTALVYSTFLGGSSIDNGRSIAVNGAGEVVVGGSTTDDVTDFPTTVGAYDTTHNGLTDFFVTKINAAGSGLVWSTLIGGAGIDNGAGIAIDQAGSVYVTGSVTAGFPTTAGVFDTTAAGSTETGICKFGSDGSTLVYSTYLGGTQSEVPNAIAVDRFGFAYVTGNNFGGDFPMTVGAYDTTQNGSNDVFLSVINQNANAIAYSTYVGGGGADDANDIALDTVGNIYLAGRTVAAGVMYPVTPDAFQTLNGGSNDAFVTKFGDFAIGGKVIDSTTGNPLSNVMVALSGQVSGTVLTGPDGRFGFLDTVPGEPHAVSATRPGYSMNPAVWNIAALAANRELIFVASVGTPTGGTGGTLRFENISYNKAENGGSVNVTINRVGQIQTTDPVTVDFTTVEGSAQAGQDYAPTTGVVTFNALETSKTVSIPIVNDGVLEPKESFTVAISNPTNNSDIDPGHAVASVKILDEDVSAGSLLISEFRERGRLGAKDEYVKLFNPNDFDVTVQTSDGSPGLVLAASTGNTLSAVATIPNQVTIGARGHYLLTNNDPFGGFSIIDYPTGRGSVTAVGDGTFTTDIPDNASLVLMKTSNPTEFTVANVVDAVGFEGSNWYEGKPLPALENSNSEWSYVRKFAADGLEDAGNNRADFLLVENHAASYSSGGSKIYSVLGAPAPETSESLRLFSPAQTSLTDYGIETYDPTPVPNGPQGTLTVYRTIVNNTGGSLIALRLRAISFPTAGSELQRRYSSHPDFRIATSPDEGTLIKGSTLAAERLQPNGGGINSTLSVDSVTPANPLLPGQSVVVAIRFTVVKYGRHPLKLAVEGSN